MTKWLMPHEFRILALFGGIPLFGQERGNIETLAALKAEGCAVHCLVRGEPWAADVRAALSSRGIEWSVIPYLNAWRPGDPLSTLMRNLAAFIVANVKFMAICRRLSPTHIHAFNTHYVLNVLLGLLLTRTPVVFRAGDKPPMHNLPSRLLWRYVSTRSARIVAISHFISDSLQALGTPAAKLSVIYNRPPGRVDPAPFKMPAAFARRDQFRIVYVGQIIEAKGVHLLVDAFRSLADIPAARLVIAGRISDWDGDQWARTLRQRVGEDPTIGDRVLFTGYVDDVPSLLRSCDLLVAPSLVEEALGNVVVEAKAAGLPAIVFPRGGLPELIEHERDGLVCATPTAESLAMAMRRCLSKPRLFAALKRNAGPSLAKYGMVAFGRDWLLTYERALCGAE